MAIGRDLYMLNMVLQYCYCGLSDSQPLDHVCDIVALLKRLLAHLVSFWQSHDLYLGKDYLPGKFLDGTNLI